MQRSRFATYAARCIVACCSLCFTSAELFSQNQPQQVIILKDPTPREPDLEKKFAKKPATPTDPARLAAYNRQRLQLTQQAADHLHSLAVALQGSLDQKQVATRVAQEIKVAEAIEALAGNVHTAMSSTSEHARTGRVGDPAVDSIPATQATNVSEAEKLTTLTSALQVDVSRSSVDMVAVGVLTRSAEIKQLASRMKQRLHENASEH